MSAAIKLSPSKPRRIVLNSLVDHPPVSGVPVAGATILSVSIVQQSKLTSRIQSVNVNAEIDCTLADSLLDLVNDSLCSNGVNFSSFYDFESAIAIVFVVTGTREGGSDTGMDIAVVCEQPFLSRMPKVGTMVNGGLLGGCASKNLWLPGVPVS
jgi:hypothetical protein